MKLLLVTTGFPANPRSYRGIFVLRSLCHLLKSHGVHAKVLTPAGEDEAPLFSTPESWHSRLDILRYHYAWPHSLETLARGSIIANLGSSPWKIFLVGLLLLANARVVLRHSRPCDIIHCQWIISALFPVLFKFWHRRPVVVTIQGSDLNAMRGKLGSALNRFILRRCDHVIPMTQVQFDEIRHVAQDSTLIPNGVDDEAFRPCAPDERVSLRAELGFPAKEVIVLYVGMLIPVKGLDLLVAVFDKLRGAELPPHRCILVGDGPERQRLEARVRELGLDDRFYFAGSAEPALIPRWTRAADIAVSTSHTEGLSTTLCEAAACELPIVATRAGDTRIIVEHGASGFIVENRDADAYSAHLAGLIREPELRSRFGHRGRQRLLARKLTARDCAAGYAEVYKKCLGSSARLS